MKAPVPKALFNRFVLSRFAVDSAQTLVWANRPRFPEWIDSGRDKDFAI